MKSESVCVSLEKEKKREKIGMIKMIVKYSGPWKK